MGQQIPVDPSLAQFPFWQSWLFVHEPPLAVLAMQLPLPSQARFEPHDVPTDAFDALQTGIPVVQLYVPGAQVVPQEAFGVQVEPPVPPVPAPPVPPPPVVPLLPAVPDTPLAPPEPGTPAPPPAPPAPTPPVVGPPAPPAGAPEAPPRLAPATPPEPPAPPLLPTTPPSLSVWLVRVGQAREVKTRGRTTTTAQSLFMSAFSGATLNRLRGRAPDRIGGTSLVYAR